MDAVMMQIMFIGALLPMIGGVALIASIIRSIHAAK